MSKPDSYILTIDEGTTSVRSIVWNRSGIQVSSSQEEITQIYPRPGWVEHDPSEIWRLTLKTMMSSVERAKITTRDLSCIGITNQRETTLLWERSSGAHIHNALVCQD